MIVGCRSRKLETSESKEALKEQTNLVQDSVINTTALEAQKTVVRDKIKVNTGGIKIVGKTDTLNPFEYLSIVEGDTLGLITIRGNADFTIQHEWKQKEKDYVEEKINVIAEVARTAVSKSTLTKASKEVKSIEKSVKANGFTFGTWVWIALGGIVLGIIAYLYFTYGKTIRKWLPF